MVSYHLGDYIVPFIDPDDTDDNTPTNAADTLNFYRSKSDQQPIHFWRPIHMESDAQQVNVSSKKQLHNDIIQGLLDAQDSPISTNELGTHQGKDPASEQGCAVIATFICVQHVLTQNGITNEQLVQIIDVDTPRDIESVRTLKRRTDDSNSDSSLDCMDVVRFLQNTNVVPKMEVPHTIYGNVLLRSDRERFLKFLKYGTGCVGIGKPSLLCSCMFLAHQI